MLHDDGLEPNWPLSNRALPASLFPDEHLRAILFDCLPVLYRCAAATIRQGLKVHLKRTLPGGFHNPANEQSARDRAMAATFCNISAARDRATEIAFIVQENHSQRGRSGTRGCRLPPVHSFADLLWSGYQKAPEMAELFSWFMEVAAELEESDKKFYVKSASLVKALAEGVCPVGPDDLWFGRSVVLFGSLLPESERVNLFQTAARIGCSPIADAYPQATDRVLKEILTNEEQKQEIGEAARLEHPKLATAESFGWGAWSASSSVTSQIAALEAAEQARLDRWLDAESALRIDATAAIYGPPEVWQSVSVAVADARNAVRHYERVRGSCEALYLDILNKLRARFGCSPTASQLDSKTSVHVVATILGQVDAMRVALDALDASPGLLFRWQADLTADQTITTLQNTVHAVEREIGKCKAQTVFRTEVSAFSANARAFEVTAFLEGLDCRSLSALLPDLTEGPWILAGAILLQALLERCPRDQLDIVFLTLSKPPAQRRALLHFVDPTSSQFDSSEKIRRIIGVERLRDALTFGPLAQISDPAAGLSDITLVGRSIHELSELVVNNLDILSGGSDLVRMLRAPPQRAEVVTRLVNFIHAPVTMHGNFRRLREKARELLLLPLLADDVPDAKKVKELAQTIATGRCVDEVAKAFESERPDDRLEPRHREQLARYLNQAEHLLADYLRETNERPDGRCSSFASRLRKIYSKLRKSGDIGTVEWFEAEVVLMLKGEEAGGDHPTLVGNATLISSRIWDDADRDWAAAFVDLPVFHGPLPLASFEIAASVLHWRSRNTLPSVGDTVSYLIDQQAFHAALLIAQDANVDAVEAMVLAAAGPFRVALESRVAEMHETLDQDSPLIEFDRYRFEAALSVLDFDAAEEILDLWQLNLAEEKEKSAVGSSAPIVDERRLELFEALRNCGIDTVDEQISTVELGRIWTDILATRQNERIHLTAVSSVLKGCAALQPDLASHLADFDRSSESPHLWLPAAVSSAFADLVQEATPQIAAWVSHSHNFREEEQAALVALSTWYLDFVSERSKSLHDQDQDDTVQAGLFRVLEVAAIVLESKKPSDCIRNLFQSGEMDARPSAITTTSPNVGRYSPGQRVAVNIPEKLAAGAPQSASDWPLPDALLGALQGQDWRRAVEVCETFAYDADLTQAGRLRSLARCIGPLSDQAALPENDVADAFPSTAVWLSGQLDGAAHVNESRKVELAFQLLAGAIAADSGQEMPRASGQGGSWADLLSRASPFRRMLTTGLPSRTGRVMEALVSGTLALVVAERLWDGATNLSEPQHYRTPLLNFLSDHGAQEVIIKLAQRHEVAIVSRLSQLFDLRAVAQNRPDLLPVAQSVAEHLAAQAKTAPFRSFVKNLPSAAHMVKPTLRVALDGSVLLRRTDDGTSGLELPIVVTPEGLVPAKLFAKLFPEDDVTFEDNTRLKELSREPIYFATDFSVSLRFGRSWVVSDTVGRDSVRIRIEAKTVTDEIVQEDAICPVRSIDRALDVGRQLDIETLLELYPGVANTPVVDKSFVGRIDELERLHQVLVSARNPSPVLLTGMRRVGKTSLLYAFHQRFSSTSNGGAISFYQSLSERKVELSSLDYTVSGVFFKAISHGLVRPHLPAHDRNYALCVRIREYFNNDWKAARAAIKECYDEESLASSLMILVERLRSWTASNARFIFLIDEAEALVAPYQAGGRKKLELEQFLQSLREVSQTTSSIGLLLSGSNHINMFSREYKNAFFGSSQSIELEGFDDVDVASQIVAPKGVDSFIRFEAPAISYAWSLCAGMPQFLWQVGAATASQVRTGVATRSDIRAAIALLVGPERVKLPFRPYEILEPIDNMLSLEVPRERDLLWMLLYRVAQASSLAAQNATIPFVIDQSLLAVDDRIAWKRRLGVLVDLKVLRIESASSVLFQVPLFAEGFRAPKNWQEFNIRQQQVAI